MQETVMEAILLLAGFFAMFLAIWWSLQAERLGGQASEKGLFGYFATDPRLKHLKTGSKRPAEPMRTVFHGGKNDGS